MRCFVSVRYGEVTRQRIPTLPFSARASKDRFYNNSALHTSMYKMLLIILMFLNSHTVSVARWGFEGIGGVISKTGKTDCTAGRGWQRLSWRLGSDESPAKPKLAKIHSRRHLITSFRNRHRLLPTTNLTRSSTRQLNQQIP